jgi:cytochrome P450
MRLTLRIIIRVALGDVSMLDAYFQDSRLYTDARKIFDFLIERSLFPLNQFVWDLFYSKLETDAKVALKGVTEVVTKIVEMEREKSMQPADTSGAAAPPKSYIQILFRECASSSENAITNVELVSNVTTLLLAGSETTSVTVSWAMFYLSQHAGLLAEARAEVDAYFRGPDGGSLGGATAAAFEEFLLGQARNKANEEVRFPFCAACFKEVLRMSGPAAFVGLELVDNTKPVTLSNGIVIRPTDTLFCYHEGLHMDAAVFPAPGVFDPHRWLDAAPAELERMNAHYFAFGSGPRVCPGKGLAYFEGELILASLVACFDFKLACDAKEVKRQMSFTAQPNRVPMIFSKRI